MNNQTEEEHIIDLSKELIDDIELGRLPSDKLILKSSRLARLAGSEQIQQWLNYEMVGYNSSNKISLHYMSATGRWVNYEEKKGYWGPLGEIEANIESKKSELQAINLTSVSGDYAATSITIAKNNHANISQTIRKLSGIRSRVLGLLHTFAVGIYYERQFVDIAQNTFEGFRKDIDGLIADKAGDVLIKIPSVIDRLKKGDNEAISQALTTCRRIIESFSDAIFPPSDDKFDIDGNSLSLGADKYQNRINAYIASRTNSKSRRTRLRQNISNLYDRVSTGVHSDVSSQEAYAIFLNVYLFLGEVLNLGEPEAPMKQTEHVPI